MKIVEKKERTKILESRVREDLKMMGGRHKSSGRQKMKFEKFINYICLQFGKKPNL
mgnify:CR=1 FL=1